MKRFDWKFWLSVAGIIVGFAIVCLLEGAYPCP